MRTSILDLFRIGIGPSSSHTVGPMRAAREFALALERMGLAGVGSIRAELFGSLALTGIGHGTDRAVVLGLLGEQPELVKLERIEALLGSVRESGTLRVLGKHAVPFVEAEHLRWNRNVILPGHPNGVQFAAFDPERRLLHSEIYYSIGGGFIRREGSRAEEAAAPAVPHPYSSARELLDAAAEADLPIWTLVLENEKALHGEVRVRASIIALWEAMSACIERGLHTEGILPGGLNVRRRAPRLYAKLRERAAQDPMSSMDWLNVFAMAVNEENAAGGRIVTAPTNGAAGVIPAVLRYYEDFMPDATREGIQRFFLAAGAIGVLYKENASISGAEVGCQGEVGVACSMAAAGLVAALSGSNEEIEHAAEIAMEHHLGMTCDPIGGLVQIPCIERNAIGAVKAVNACRLAMQEDGVHKVALDHVIRTMLETGRDMQSRYKETSLGGLAVNVIEC